MNAFICIILYTFLLQSIAVQGKEKLIKKRQIYREQVLPHAGGKIPDTAFQSDRLLLNRLQKEGIAVPDGVAFEQRNPQVHPYTSRVMRPVYKVQATQDNRYTPIEGRYFYQIPPGIETTYLYPQIHNVPLRYAPLRPMIPQIRPLIIPSSFATDNLKTFTLKNKNNKNTVYLVTVDPKNTFGKSSTSSNFLSVNNNLKTYLPPDFLTPTLFSQFDNLFSGYNYRVSRSANKIKSKSITSSSNKGYDPISNNHPIISIMPMMKGS